MSKPEMLPARRGANGQFLAGSGSPNPGGRPKQVREVVELARASTVEVIEALREIVLDRDAQAMARVRAAECLLQRGWGAVMPEPAVDDLLAADTVEFRLVLGPAAETIETAEWHDAI